MTNNKNLKLYEINEDKEVCHQIKISASMTKMKMLNVLRPKRDLRNKEVYLRAHTIHHIHLIVFTRRSALYFLLTKTISLFDLTSDLSPWYHLP